MAMSEATVTHIAGGNHHRADVATAVKAHLAIRDISDAAASRMLGMSQSAFSRRTHSNIALDTDELGALADALGISFIELVQMPTGRPEKITNGLLARVTHVDFATRREITA